jgi:hypothetical protein
MSLIIDNSVSSSFKSIEAFYIKTILRFHICHHLDRNENKLHFSELAQHFYSLHQLHLKLL